jgi:electron transport complex protein RnfE
MSDSGRNAQFERIGWLALCPLLAVSDTVVNALGISVAILISVPLCVAVILAVRRRLTGDMLLAGSMLIVAGSLACIELLMTAWFRDLRQSLGIFVPLIVANVVLIGRMQRSSPAGTVVVDAFKLSISVAAALLVLSLARELVGRGSLFHGAGLLNPAVAALETKIFSVDMGFLLALLPPGAFISLGLLLAARNWLARIRSADKTLSELP